LETFNVLLVDDEAEFLETLVKRIKKRDVNVTGVESGEKALEFLDEQPVDVVVLDVRMPGMDGIETLRSDHADRPCELGGGHRRNGARCLRLFDETHRH